MGHSKAYWIIGNLVIFSIGPDLFDEDLFRELESVVGEECLLLLALHGHMLVDRALTMRLALKFERMEGNPQRTPELLSYEEKAHLYVKFFGLPHDTFKAVQALDEVRREMMTRNMSGAKMADCIETQLSWWEFDLWEPRTTFTLLASVVQIVLSDLGTAISFKGSRMSASRPKLPKKNV